jgi:hypothetical protein
MSHLGINDVQYATFCLVKGLLQELYSTGRRKGLWETSTSTTTGFTYIVTSTLIPPLSGGQLRK